MSNGKKYNNGILFLRILLTLSVILNHFWETDEVSRALMPLFTMRSVAVPVFMLMSFYLTESKVLSGAVSNLKKRFVRLATPFFVWGGVSWLVLFLAEKVLKTDMIDGFKALLWQFVTGHGYHVNAPLWYMAVLIWLTVLYSLIFMLPNKKTSFVLIHVIAVVALILQYSGLNYNLFKDFPFEAKYPLGRVAEMIPYATLGYDIAHFRIYDWVKKNKLRENVILWISLAIVIILLVFGETTEIAGYGYNGIYRMIISVSLLTFFYLLPIEKISGQTENVIKALTAHTLGIYCMHYLVGNILKMGLEYLHISINQIVFCIMLYVICYIIAMIISKIPNRFVKQLVD